MKQLLSILTIIATPVTAEDLRTFQGEVFYLELLDTIYVQPEGEILFSVDTPHPDITERIKERCAKRYTSSPSNPECTGSITTGVVVQEGTPRQMLFGVE